MEGIRTRTVVLFAAFFMTAVGLQAQLDVNGTVSGTAKDQTGAIIAKLTVVLSNLDTGAQRQSTSATDGTYIIPSVAPGRYSLTAKAPGFKTYVLSEFRLEVKQQVTLDLAMQVGQVAETIEVTGEAPLLNATDATIGTVIQQKEVVEMPLNGRHFSQLLLLAPGASPDQAGQQDSFTIALGDGGVSPAMNGMRAQMNNFRLDGVDNNMRFTNSFGTSPPPDAIQEVKASGHDSDAQVSFAAGGNINVTTRAGTNIPHGSLWEFVRNDKFSASNFIDNYLGSSKLPYRQNQYGFFFGAPVFVPYILDGRKTKTYFSAYWEGFKSRRTSNTTATVPSQAFRNGDFSSTRTLIYDPLSVKPCSTCSQGFTSDPFAGNVIPAARVSAIAKGYMQFIYPLPNRVTNPNFVIAQNRTQDSTNWGVRVDHNLSTYDHVYGRFSRYFITQNTPAALPATAAQRLNNGGNGMVTYSHVFTPTFLVDFQVGYNRASIPGRTVPLGDDYYAAVGDSLASKLAFGYLPTSVTLSGSTYNSAAFSNSDLANPDYAYQYNLDFKKVKGKHNLGFGFRLLHWRHIIGPAGTSSMTYVAQTTGLPGTNGTGDPLASFLVGLPRDTDKSTLPAAQMAGNVYVGYVQENWKVSPKLTLNLGVQYAYASPPTQNKDISTFDYATALTRPQATDWSFAYLWTGKNPITGEGPNTNKSILFPDRNNFAPRIGIAYRAMPNFVIRTGFGVFYDYNTNLIQNAGVRVADRNWPYFASGAIAGQNLTGPGPNNPAITLANPYIPPVLPRTAPAPVTTGTSSFPFDRYARDPYVMRWNFGFERLLPHELVFSIAYLGAGSRKLPVGVQANTALAGPDPVNPRRPLPRILNSFTQWLRITNASYHALQTKIEKRWSRGMTFRDSFTWSKSLDTTSDSNTGAIEYPAEPRLSRGPSDFDRTVMNVFSYVWELPIGKGRKIAPSAHGVLDKVIGGWQLSGIVTHRSGRRYHIATGRDSANIGTSFPGSVKANIIGDPTPAGFHQTREAWFDKNAFSTPAFGALGTMSRNALKADPFGRVDILLGKDFRLTERVGIEFRTEFFNAFNQTTFGLPVNTITSTTFGQILTTAQNSRDIQFGLKLHW